MLQISLKLDSVVTNSALGLYYKQALKNKHFLKIVAQCDTKISQQIRLINTLKFFFEFEDSKIRFYFPGTSCKTGNDMFTKQANWKI